MSLEVVSGGERAYIMGDVSTARPQITETEWVFAFDMDAAQAVETRRRMIERAETDEAVMASATTGPSAASSAPEDGVTGKCLSRRAGSR